MSDQDFVTFPKIARLSRECIVTEKIDGTNAQVMITQVGVEGDGADVNSPLVVSSPFKFIESVGVKYMIAAGSRSQWIGPKADNFGFAAWVHEHAAELVKLGPGRHFGEWWGSGIQRGYGLPKGEKRLSLFNVSRWHLAGTPPHVWKQNPRSLHGHVLEPVMSEELPACVGLVPILGRGQFDELKFESFLALLEVEGSRASPGFMQPEGIVVFHTAAGVGFKKTLKKDDEPKGKS